MSNTTSSRSSSSSVDSSKVQKESPVKIDKIAQTAERAERNARLRAEAEKVVADRQVAGPKVQKEAPMKTKQTNKPAQKKTVKVMPLCGCGCGARTGGGIFRPGHDAKLKSQLFAASRAGDEKATAELTKRGWLWLMAAPKVKVVANRTRAELEDDSVFLAQLATMPEDGTLTI